MRLEQKTLSHSTLLTPFASLASISQHTPLLLMIYTLFASPLPPASPLCLKSSSSLSSSSSVSALHVVDLHSAFVSSGLHHYHTPLPLLCSGPHHDACVCKGVDCSRLKWGECGKRQRQRGRGVASAPECTV
uniref:Uncharacterized protein n=1 Tax=Physcomitrium patens TaxID=3218 RepID=A0A7I3ZFG2_PHYPA